MVIFSASFVQKWHYFEKINPLIMPLGCSYMMSRQKLRCSVRLFEFSLAPVAEKVEILKQKIASTMQ